MEAIDGLDGRELSPPNLAWLCQKLGAIALEHGVVAGDIDLVGERGRRSGEDCSVHGSSPSGEGWKLPRGQGLIDSIIRLKPHRGIFVARMPAGGSARHTAATPSVGCDAGNTHSHQQKAGGLGDRSHAKLPADLASREGCFVDVDVGMPPTDGRDRIREGEDP